MDDLKTRVFFFEPFWESIIVGPPWISGHQQNDTKWYKMTKCPSRNEAQTVTEENWTNWAISAGCGSQANRFDQNDPAGRAGTPKGDQGLMGFTPTPPLL